MFILCVVKCGVEIIDVCGLLLVVFVVSVMIDYVCDWVCGIEDWMLVGVVLCGEYGVLEGFVCLFLVEVVNGEWCVVEGLDVDDWVWVWIDVFVVEFVEECEVV